MGGFSLPDFAERPVKKTGPCVLPLRVPQQHLVSERFCTPTSRPLEQGAHLLEQHLSPTAEPCCLNDVRESIVLASSGVSEALKDREVLQHEEVAPPDHGDWYECFISALGMNADAKFKNTDSFSDWVGNSSLCCSAVSRTTATLLFQSDDQ
jgi:hypothetical protein